MDLRYFGAAAKSLTVEDAKHSDVKPGTGKNSLCSDYCRFPWRQCPFPGNAFTDRCRCRRSWNKAFWPCFSSGRFAAKDATTDFSAGHSPQIPTHPGQQ